MRREKSFWVFGCTRGLVGNVIDAFFLSSVGRGL